MTISMANCLFIDKIGFIPPWIFHHILVEESLPYLP